MGNDAELRTGKERTGGGIGRRISWTTLAMTAIVGICAHAATPMAGLLDGLTSSYSFDGAIESFNPAGVRTTAQFERSSEAYDVSLRRCPIGVPRYLPGRFGAGVLIEYGSFTAAAANNALPGDIASTEESPNGFTAVKRAELGRAPGPQGEWALRIEAVEPLAGFATRPVTAPKASLIVFSVHLKGQSQTGLKLRVAITGQDRFLATRDITLTGDWQQEYIDFKLDTDSAIGNKAADSATSLVFSIVAKNPTTFLADAMMLEAQQGGYTIRRGATTWVEPGRGRNSEILRLGRLGPTDAAGCIAFWARLRGSMTWRTLLMLGDGSGWLAPLRLDVRGDKTIELLPPDAKQSARHPLPDPFGWHHYAVVWNDSKILLYLDGDSIAKLDPAPGLANVGGITLGGVAVNGSPGLRADAVFDEVARWNRELADAEVAQLAARTQPIEELFKTKVAISDLAPVKVFARDLPEVTWPLAIFNRTDTRIPGALFSYGVPGLFSIEKKLGEIPASGKLQVSATFTPALLLPGDYQMQFVYQSTDGHRLDHSAPFTVAKSRVPRDNAQVISWGGMSQAMADAGVTVGGIWGGLQGPPAHQVEEASRRGLYVQLKLGLSAGGETREDHFIDAAGRQQGADQSTPAARVSIRDQVEQLATTLERFPDVTHTILNCEAQWIWSPDFRDATVTRVRERFGLDLDRWRRPPITNASSITTTFGRLMPERGGIAAPESGIIPVNDPFYAYSRWWQSGEAGNEVYLNDTIAGLLRERVPRLSTISEPALRRPAVRTFREQGILNEWFYYPDPRRAIWVQEELTAAVRGTRSHITGMPQFLLKPGMAAPYGGMPTPTLFREAVWHCLTRPSAGLTYWNLWAALERGGAKHGKTQSEIDELLGPKPSWKEAAAKIEVRGETSSVFLWIPELSDEIGRLHRELVHPLGGLWPRWRNAPRRVAVYKSFAGQLFNGIRWPGGGALGEAVAAVGMPFDVLYDQDFEEFPDVLRSYAVVAIPEAPVITEPAAAALRAFAARGGVVIVDQSFMADLPGVVRADFKDTGDVKALQKAERELMALYGDPVNVLYIEGMQEAGRRFAASSSPINQIKALLLERAAADVRSVTPSVSLNLLEAGAARYLTAVNSLAKPGPWYGHFGRVLDQGVEQTAEISLAAGLGAVAYRLDGGAGRIGMQTDTDGYKRLCLPLAPGGGAVVLLLPRPIAAVKLAPAAESTPPRRGWWRTVADLPRRLCRVYAVNEARGQWLPVAASLIDDQGALVPGVVPARIEIVGPDGNTSDLSRYDAFCDGRWSLKIPIALNQPPGVYRLTVTELASGLKTQQTWKIE